MSVDVTSAILASIVSATVAIAILFKRPRRPLYLYFSAFTLALFLWHAAAVAASVSGHFFELRLWAALIVAAAAGYFFRDLLRDRSRTAQRLSRLATVISAILFIINLTPLHDEFAVRLVSSLYVVASLSLVLHGLYSRTRNARYEEKKRLGLLFYGGVTTLLLTAVAAVPGSGEIAAAAGHIAATAYVYFLYQSIVARRLVDLVELMGKASVLAVLTLMLALIYGVLVRWVGSGESSLWLFNTLVASFVILILYDQVRTFVEETTSRLLFRERYEVKQVLRRLLHSVRTTISLPQMRDLVLETLYGSGRAGNVALYLQIEGEQAFGLFGFRGQKPPDTMSLAEQPALLLELRRERKPILLEHLVVRQQELPFLTHDDPTVQRETERTNEAIAAMRQMGANAIIPMLAEDRITGILCIGVERLTEAYSADELSAFLSLAEACAIVIENSKEYEQRRERDRLAAVGEMAAGMAHEIRNPLGAIKGAAQCLDPAGLPKESEEFVNVIIEEVDRLNRVVAAFLEYARPYRGNPEPTAVNAVVSGTLKLISRDPVPANVVFEQHLAADLPPVNVDPEQLKQILLNLIQNAVQAMPNGGTITVSTILSTARRADFSGSGGPRLIDAEHVLVRVRDTGDGIRTEDLPRIFVPFFTTKPTGTGLGLALSQRMVENANGRLEVSSRPSEGATFTVRLPALSRGALPAGVGAMNPSPNPN